MCAAVTGLTTAYHWFSFWLAIQRNMPFAEQKKVKSRTYAHMVHVALILSHQNGILVLYTHARTRSEAMRNYIFPHRAFKTHKKIQHPPSYHLFRNHKRVQDETTSYFL